MTEPTIRESLDFEVWTAEHVPEMAAFRSRLETIITPITDEQLRGLLFDLDSALFLLDGDGGDPWPVRGVLNDVDRPRGLSLVHKRRRRHKRRGV